jgi:hypothetical protein
MVVATWKGAIIVSERAMSCAKSVHLNKKHFKRIAAAVRPIQNH